MDMEIQERNDTFKSLEAPSEGLYKEKGSKFLAFAYPVTSEDITAMRTGSGWRAVSGG